MGDERSVHRRIGAVKHNNNIPEKAQQCSSNGHNGHRINVTTTSAYVTLPGSVTNSSSTQKAAGGQINSKTQAIDNWRKNSIFGVLRVQNDGDKENGSGNKDSSVISCQGAGYIQNTPNVHLYEMDP